MPVPKSKPQTAEAVEAGNTGVAIEAETELLTAPVTVEGVEPVQTVIEGAEGSTSINGEAPPKPRRGRQKGAPTAPPFDQQMFFIMRAQARKLGAQQIAASLPDNIDVSKLFEAVKGYPGFEGVDLGRLKSKYKAALKELSESAKWEEISSGGMSHPLYLPPLSDSRSKIDVFALEG